MESSGLLQTRKSSYRSLLSRRNLVPSGHATNWLLLPKWRMPTLMCIEIHLTSSNDWWSDLGQGHLQKELRVGENPTKVSIYNIASEASNVFFFPHIDRLFLTFFVHWSQCWVLKFTFSLLYIKGFQVCSTVSSVLKKGQKTSIEGEKNKSYEFILLEYSV